MWLPIKSALIVLSIILLSQESALCQLRNEVVDGDSILIFTQPMRDKFEESVFAAVYKPDSLFKYEFEILSGINSQQSIWFWMILTKADIRRSASPSGWRFINRAKNPRRITWGAQSDSVEIRPSERKSNFELESPAPPTIKTYYMEGWAQYILKEEPDSVENASFFDVTKKGYTVFPRDSAIENIIELTDTLETFRFRSCEELDWATDATVCGQLENELSQVKTALLAEDSLAAANALQRFIDLVEAEKEASLTSEGYALLYFNGQYLKKRIDEED